MREAIFYGGIKQSWQKISHGYIENTENQDGFKLILRPKFEPEHGNREVTKKLMEEIKALIVKNRYCFVPSKAKGHKGVCVTKRRHRFNQKQNEVKK